MNQPTVTRWNRNNENQGRGPHPRTILDLTRREALIIVALMVVIFGGLSLVPSYEEPLVVATTGGCR